MRVKVELDLDVIFEPRTRAVMERYFKRERTALECTVLLGWSRGQWERALSGLFSVAKAGDVEGCSLEVVGVG